MLPIRELDADTGVPWGQGNTGIRTQELEALCSPVLKPCPHPHPGALVTLVPEGEEHRTGLPYPANWTQVC